MHVLYRLCRICDWSRSLVITILCGPRLNPKPIKEAPMSKSNNWSEDKHPTIGTLADLSLNQYQAGRFCGREVRGCHVVVGVVGKTGIYRNRNLLEVARWNVARTHNGGCSQMSVLQTHSFPLTCHDVSEGVPPILSYGQTIISFLNNQRYSPHQKQIPPFCGN